MRTIEEVQGRCRIDEEGHWIWTGSTRRGSPNIHAPNFTADDTGKTCTVQLGRRAVWHIITGKPIRKGRQVYQTCGHALCLRPSCLACGTKADQGRMVSTSGRERGKENRIQAGRANCASQRKVTPTMHTRIMADLAIGVPVHIVANKHDLHRDTIRRVRMGRSTAAANPFAGLMR